MALLSLAFVFLFLPISAFAVSSITSGPTVTGTLSPGQAITTTFVVTGNCACANPLYFALGISDSNSMTGSGDIKRTNWIADPTGIFGSATYWVNGVSRTVTNLSSTSVTGPGNGILLGATNAGPYTVNVVSRIPQELVGTYYMHLVTRESTLTGNCTTGLSVDGKANTTLTITGTPTYRFNLQLSNDSSSADGVTISATKLRYRISNFGEAGVPLTNFKWRFFINRDGIAVATYRTYSIPNVATYMSGGTAYCNQANNASGAFTAMATTTCAGSRGADMYFQWSPVGAWANDSSPYLVAGGGGYAEPTTAITFDNNTGATNRTNDYSRPTDYPTSSNPNTAGSDQIYSTLYYNSALVCEYTSATVQDANSGQEPCSISGTGCGSTPTFTPTNTPSPTFTATVTPTYTVTIAATKTVTPLMELTKTSSLGTATIGDTITFCFQWHNDSSGTVFLNVWDTISTFLTYVGCDSSCAQAGSMVSWSFSSGSNTAGTVCFWGTVNGYPFMPELLEPRVIEARREDLEQLYGLLPWGGASF